MKKAFELGDRHAMLRCQRGVRFELLSSKVPNEHVQRAGAATRSELGSQRVEGALEDLFGPAPEVRFLGVRRRRSDGLFRGVEVEADDLHSTTTLFGIRLLT